MTPRDGSTGTGRSIFAVRCEIGNLEDLATEWDDLYPDQQDDFLIEWSNAMAHLRAVERARAAGELSAKEEGDYAPVRARLVEILPTVERLGLPGPGVPLDRGSISP